jgi:hypothetical protein
MQLERLPTFAASVACVLFAVAASRYPGGFVWSRNFISEFFLPTLANGAPNSARPWAIAAMFFACASIGVAFQRLTRRATSRVQRSVLEIGGIGAAVYGFCAVTPLHHGLMIGLGLAFFFPAMAAALVLARSEQRRALFWSGVVSVALIAITAAMYYGELAWHALPLAQKASMAACWLWVLALQATRARP